MKLGSEPGGRVSVIIPAYNALAYVEETVDSVLAQSVPPYEIIVVDDGSTDGTGALLESRYGRDNRIQVFHTPNRGLGPARNFGIEKATGEFVYFLDADDKISARLFEEFSQALVREPALDLFCFANQPFFDEAFPADQRGSLPNLSRRLSGVFPSGQEAMVALDRAASFYAFVQMYILRKRLLSERSLEFLAIVHEDIDFTCRLFLAAQRTVVVDQRLLSYRLRLGSITKQTITPAHVEGYLTAVESLDGLLATVQLPAPTRTALLHRRRQSLSNAAGDVMNLNDPATRAPYRRRILRLSARDPRQYVQVLVSWYVPWLLPVALGLLRAARRN